MKKNSKRDQGQNKQPRRLTLSRETIHILHDPALFGVAGGGVWSGKIPTTTTMDPWGWGGGGGECNP